MSKNQKSNKKFIVGASIALLVIFLVTFGATWGITYASMDDPTFINFYIDGQQHDINDINDMAAVPALREETGTETDDSDETIDDSDAQVLSAKFYSAALFGTTDYIGFNRIGEIEGSLIMDADSPFNIPESFNGGEVPTTEAEAKAAAIEYKNNFVQMKLFNETLHTPVYRYLVDMNSDNPEIIDLIHDIETGVYTGDVAGRKQFTEWEYTDIQGTPLYDDLVLVLGEDVPYQESVLQEMFVYSYLWQDSKNKKYDYNFTEALVESKASLVSQMKIDSDNAGADLTAFHNTDDSGDEAEITIDNLNVNAEDWNEAFDANTDALVETDIDDQLILGTDPKDEGFKGFQGIQFGTTENTSFKEDFYNTSKTWDLSSDWTTATTTSGAFTNEDILTNANYYVADPYNDGAPGNGPVISDEDTSGTLGDPTSTVSVASYSQLYPYMFADIKGTGDDAYLTNPTFSLYATEEVIDAGTDDEKTVYEKATADDDSARYIFNRWFGDDLEVFGEIYVAEALITHESLMKSEALDFWNNEGYYIELSGEASTDYTSLLPSEILKKED